MNRDLFLLLLMSWGMLFCVAQSESEHEAFRSENQRRSYRDWKESLENIPQSANIMKNVAKRDVSDPLQNAGEQLSIFNSLLNSVSLAESIGQKITTFGEIGVDLMLVQNIPVDGNGISSIDSKDIHTENTEDLQKVMENGFDGNVSIDVIEKLMVIEEGISAIDDLVKSFEAVKNVKEKYDQKAFLSFGDYTNALRFLYFLPEAFSTISSLSKDPAPLDSLKSGAEFINKFTSTGFETIKNSYESCKFSISSDECVTGFEVIRKMSFENISTSNIETVAVVLHFSNSLDKLTSLPNFIEKKNEITSMYENLLNFQKFIGTQMDFESLKEKVSKMFPALSDLKDKTSELQETANVLKAFLPVFEVIAKIPNGHQDQSHKRIRKANEHSTSVLDTIRRLSKGITSLAELSKVTRLSGTPPNEYRNSELVERTKVMEQFTTQREEFLKFSGGVGSVQYISVIISNIQLFHNQVSNYISLETEITSILDENKKLGNVKNIGRGINAMADVKKRLEALTEDNCKVIAEEVKKTKFSFTTNVFSERFSKLAEVIRSAKEVDNLIKTKENADETIFDKAIEAAKQLSSVINESKVESVTEDNDIEVMKNLIKEVNKKNINLKHGEISIETIIDNLENANVAHNTIKNIIPTLSDHSEFQSGSTELQKLKDGIAKRPSQKELDAFKPMMTQLNSLKKLEISSQNEKCPHLTNLINSQNSDLLGDVSKGLIQYWRLIKGIPSIAILESENVDASIKELLNGVEAIQIIPAKDEIGAYDVFSSSQSIDEQLDKLVKYVDTTTDAISSKSLEGTIKEKAQSNLVHGFLSQLDGSVATSMKNLRSSISVILTGLKNPIGCEKKAEISPIQAETSTKVEDGLPWGLIIGLSVLCACVSSLLAICFGVYSRIKKENKKSSKPGVASPVAADGGISPVAKNGGSSDAATNQQQAVPVVNNQPAVPGAANQPAVPGAANQPAVPGAANQPAVPGAANQPAVPGAANQPAVPGAANQPAVPGAANQPAVPVATNQPAVPVATNQPAVPRAANQPAVPGAANQPAVPGAANQPAVPGAANQPAVPGAANQPAVPGAANQPAVPVAEEEEEDPELALEIAVRNYNRWPSQHTLNELRLEDIESGIGELQANAARASGASTSSASVSQSPASTAPSSPAPNRPSNAAAPVPSNPAPNRPSNAALLRPSNAAAPVPSNPAPNRPSNAALLRPSNPAPNRPSNAALLRPSNAAAPVPSNPAPNRPSNAALLRPSNAAAPVPSNPAPNRPSNAAANRPSNAAPSPAPAQEPLRHVLSENNLN